jgi:hypothetical protein
MKKVFHFPCLKNPIKEILVLLSTYPILEKINLFHVSHLRILWVYSLSKMTSDFGCALPKSYARGNITFMK